MPSLDPYRNGPLLNSILDGLERQELRSLAWGYVDGVVGEDEMYRIIDEAAGPDADCDDLLAALVDKRLAIEVIGPSGTAGFRSRFAEGVRLLARLKQLFPNQPWQGGPDLVADFRVDIRPRAYPSRTIPAETALDALAPETAGSMLRRRLVAAMLGERVLAKFQLAAASALLSPDPAGVVVCAGTGSGKTLAFYLPAMVETGLLIEPGSPWTKVLAVYPRRELLKDQLQEAYRNARYLDGVLADAGKPPVRIGAFFGLTPNDAGDRALDDVGWAEHAGGRVCPFLTCPRCAARLLWLDADRHEDRERLVCEHVGICDQVVAGHEMTLTRRSMARAAPDIVFTTAESLNQRISDVSRRHVFGLHDNPRRRARMVLLDEVHTYAGTSGAQTALLLRRWRHAHRGKVRFVGLSATLANPSDFFADLTGLPSSAVAAVEPLAVEMERSGAEYQVVLRGNPASGTSLLSTSIQASFLLARLMDPAGRSVSEGRFGKRVFAFTDDLDVTNRLFHDLRSAEGYDIFGRRRPGIEPLAALRARDRADARRRNAAGQNWALVSDIGHRLDVPLQISRTSSQDQGTDTESQLVVATAALEVGFNDTRVGAVLQHKAPQGAAAFLQRRGRAGRTQSMRPWMTTVLSDFGRDRLAYQNYEQLFDPVVSAQSLPIDNGYVLRMQAVFALLDWLSTLRPVDLPRIWIWQAVNGPAANQAVKTVQDWVVSVLRDLMMGTGGRAASLGEYLKGALGITSDQAASLLWEPPRSLLLEVVPTLARRLIAEWRLADPAAGGDRFDLRAERGVHPLPDFAPVNLFSDLSLPEVQVVVPPATVRHEPRHEFVPIVQALRTLAPGRVTRRFAPERGGLSHWVPVPLDRTEDLLPIGDFCPGSTYLGTFLLPVDGIAVELACHRPWHMTAQPAPRHVKPSSNARLRWTGAIVAPEDGVTVRPPPQTVWAEVAESATFYLHAMRQPATVRRFASGATARVRLEGREDPHVVETQFVDGEGRRSGIGFEMEVDALVLRYRPPAAGRLDLAALPATAAGSWRVAHYRDTVLGDAGLDGFADDFQRDALQQAYFAALLLGAERHGESLDVAAARLEREGVSGLAAVLAGVFGGDLPSDADDGGPGAAPPPVPGPAQRANHNERRLRDLLDSPLVRGRLAEAAALLWLSDGGPGWADWLRERLHDALGQAFVTACWNVAPRRGGGDALVLDLGRGVDAPQDGVRELWVSESIIGGAGVLAAIAEATAADPGMLLRAVEIALSPGDLELAADELERFVDLVVSDAAVVDAASRVRAAADHQAHAHEQHGLFGVLDGRGLVVSHAVAVALNARLLRPGTDAGTDRLIADLFSYWRELERRHAVAVDLRPFCLLAALHPSFGPRIAALPGADGRKDVRDAVHLLSGLLWPRAAELRRRSLDAYSPFADFAEGDPSLVRVLLLGGGSRPEVDIGGTHWLADAAAALSRAGACMLVCPRGAEAAMGAALCRIVATPVDMDFLQLYPSVDEITREGGRIAVTVVLREVT